MTTRSRQPDRKRLADIADGRTVGGSKYTSQLSKPRPWFERSDKRQNGAGREPDVTLTRRRDRSLSGGVRQRTAGAALVLVVLAGACSDDGEPIAEPTTTSRPSTTTSTEPAAEDEVVDRYLAFWEARREANTAPVNPDHPALPEYAAEAQLDQVVLETTQRRDQGLALRAAADPVGEHRVDVVELDADTATLQDCATDDDVVYRVATGEVVDDAVATRNVEATMRLVEGEWKLVRTRVVQTWEGVAGCARSSGS